jgi:Na+/H+-dicarboxylate symporter
MAFHWKVLLWMVAGVACGFALQAILDGPAWSGASFRSHADGVELTQVTGPAEKAGLRVGDVFTAAVTDRGNPREATHVLHEDGDVLAVVASTGIGSLVWFLPADEASKPRSVTLSIHPQSPRARWIAPFSFAADLFIALLKMLIVPLVFSSIVTGVSGIGTLGDLRRLGTKTFVYYMGSSLLAILLGQLLVNTIRPGVGAQLGLTEQPQVLETEGSMWDILKRMVPSNVPSALTDNSAMLQIIFFALLLGFFITRSKEPHGPRVRGFFESFFDVMMRMAEGILKLLPYGVFALLVRTVASTGFEVFKPLAIYMVTVTLALVLHAGLTLPLLLKLIGGISPVRWFRAMSPALMTAFSTSSSSLTLPVSLRTVEERGKVSNKVTSFTLPLGATINMDGTALYECIGVIFLAQFYAGASGYDLTFANQVEIVVLALLASVGAAGIPSAGLVMMLTILAALNLPLEGAALLLAVDRPLDMLRTVVNVWSDSCGAAIVARTEGETGPLEAGSV